MNKADMRRLKNLAELVLDHRLAQLRKTAQAKAQSEAALAVLALPVPEPDGLQGASAALAGQIYQRWADARRAEINLVLARQTHDWMMARDDTQLAFGRAEALRALANRQSRNQPR